MLLSSAQNATPLSAGQGRYTELVFTLAFTLDIVGNLSRKWVNIQTGRVL